MIFDISQQACTETLARRLAHNLKAGDAVLLSGELGTGKTTFSRAVLRELAADKTLEVPSPTFTIVQTYDTVCGKVHHLDLWRLSGPAALFELGWDDLLRDILIVEWPDRLGCLRPPDALNIRFDLQRDGMRTMETASWRHWT